VILYRIESFCPAEACWFKVTVAGCRAPEEAIAAGEALGKIHVQFEHPGQEDQLVFKIVDVNAGLQNGDGPIN
jgi:hypothetical protein